MSGPTHQDQLNSELFDAVGQCDAAETARWLHAGADVHATDNFALRFASHKGFLRVVEVLLQAGADVHAMNDNALHLASEVGHLDVVSILLKHGADVHIRDEKPLRRAVEQDQIDIVELLLVAGADLHIWDDYPLRSAVSRKTDGMVKCLIAGGADFTTLLNTNTSDAAIDKIFVKYAPVAHRGLETVMMLPDARKIKILKRYCPKSAHKDIGEELALMVAMGLSAAQMGELWRNTHLSQPPADVVSYNQQSLP